MRCSKAILRVSQLTLLSGLVMLSGLAFASERGILIHRDGEKSIHVTIDPSLVPDAKIKRQEGKMVIELPRSVFPEDFDQKRLTVDAQLKNKNSVEVSKSDEGTAITIHSRNVYLNIEDLSQLPEPAESLATVALAGDEQGGAATGQSAKNADATTKPEPKKSLLSALMPISPATIALTAVQAAPTEPTGEAAEHADETAKAEGEQVSQPAVKPLIEGEAGRPLQEIVRRQEKPVSEDGTVPRILVSLLVVLAGVFGFTKYLLPKLAHRFPDALSATRNQAGRSKGSGLGLSGARNYLMRTGLDEDRFQVVTSTPLGGGKELHLVQIKGRQLVIATTPHSVTLLTEFKDETPAAGPTWETPEGHEPRLPVSNEPEPRYLESQAPKTVASVQEAPPLNPTEAVATPESAEEVYKKYISEAGRRQPVSQAAAQAGPYSQAAQVNLPPQAVAEPYLEAEEVVILEDYDDEYRV